MKKLNMTLILVGIILVLAVALVGVTVSRN